jgi:two-component system, chemotaxis family, protein-glutamate methylesterase/glutaminase
MPRYSHVIVIGASAGGLEALDLLLEHVPTTIGAPIIIVLHMAPEVSGSALVSRLAKYRSFNARLATDGQVYRSGHVYLAPPDNHLLIKGTRLLVTKGARENRYRPAIDPLFRSAAVTHGPGAIGVVLTGMLDDGTAGLRAIKRCGGRTVVQDPEEAPYPGMPQSALDNLSVDFCVPIREMGQLLDRLARALVKKRLPIPKDIRTEAIIAERVLSDVTQVEGLGKQVPYNCPNCGGVLWELKAKDPQRYRCHTGHSFTSAALLASQSERVEETLWVALRMFEERKNLLNSMAKSGARTAGRAAYATRAREAEVHVDRIRDMLLASQSGGEQKTPARRTRAAP